MWKLTYMEAENLCAFRHLSYTLRQGVTTLIFGDNRDNDSQQSNGAGKSALIECIAVGLTGAPLRKIRSEEIINDAAEECRVRLFLRNEAAQEDLIITRCIPRKGTSTVVCSLRRGNSEVPAQETAQPSVDAVNKYILDKLGITREELLNNFILSKYRYEDFLSSSDKEKKEIINRFSNGILVDEAIACVEGDMAPLKEEQQRLGLEIAGIDGRIEMLQEQIEKERLDREERGRTRENRMAELEAAIAAKQEYLRTEKERLNRCGREQSAVRQADGQLQTLESGDTPLEECLKAIAGMMPLFPGAQQSDWQRTLQCKKEELRQTAVLRAEQEMSIQRTAEQLARKQTAWEAFKKAYAAFCDTYRTQSDETAQRLHDTEVQLRDLTARIEELKHKRRIVSAGIDDLSNKLAGSIACPKCGHEFLVAQPQFDIPAGMQELELRRQQLSEINGLLAGRQQQTEQIEALQGTLNRERRNLESARTDWEKRLSEQEREMHNATSAVECAEQTHRRTADKVALLQEEVEGIRRKVFDEVFGFVDDRNADLEREHRTIGENIRAAECSMETLQTTLHEIQHTAAADLSRSLKESLENERRRSRQRVNEKLAVDDKVRTLEMQREHFIQFKTYLANTKIEALSRITNEFLTGIGSDIRIRFDGYTLLKSGKVREKISVSLLRDGMDCGSFGKFSAGEAARVNLATILAMQKLVNANCDDDKGLDLLVLDEILEAVDESGLAAMFEALNALGSTVLVVSHGNTAEGYPHRSVVIKEHGESRIAV